MKKRVLNVILYIAIASLLVLDIFIGVSLMGMKETGSRTGGVILDPSAEDERPGQSGGGGATKGPTVSGFSALNIPADLDTVAIDLYNPSENSGLYYMTFELRLPDESERGYEVLFLTKYVAPGKHIYQVTLSHSLSAGEYTAQLLVQPYRMSDLTPTNNVSAVVRITVK